MPGRRALWLLLLAAAVLPYFVNLGATSIIDANEAFYSETPREMIESGDVLNSTFNFEPRFNKPPLSYWLVLGAYKVFGVSLFAARLPIAIGAVVLIATAFVLGRVAFSPAAGWVAAVTLAASPRVLLFARRIIIDVYSAMFLGLTLLCFVLAETDPRNRRRWLLGMYVAAGLGMLTKGPVAVVIPALVFGVYLVVTRRLGLWRRYMLPTGALVVLAIVLPYYVALYYRFGWDYITTFFIKENVARYAEGVGAPNRGPLFYLLVVFVDFYFPWALVLPAAMALVPWRRVAFWRGGEPPADAATTSDVRLLLGLWIAIIVAFFSVSRGQQDLYVLPFIVAGAALAGGLIAGVWTGEWSPLVRRWARGSAMTMAGVLAVLGTVTALAFGLGRGPVQIAGATTCGVVLAVAGTAALAAFVQRRDVRGFVAAAIGVVTVVWVLVLVSLPDFERYKPVPKLAAVVEAQPVRPERVGTFRVAAPSLVFYLRRHVDQMVDEGQLIAFFSQGGRGYCVVKDNDYAAVRDRLPMKTRIVAASPLFDARLSDFIEAGGRQPSMLLVTTE
jgi:4-amino-4-deoxy-L-arabinose transferase-like glycosyltransferase